MLSCGGHKEDPMNRISGSLELPGKVLERSQLLCLQEVPWWRQVARKRGITGLDRSWGSYRIGVWKNSKGKNRPYGPDGAEQRDKEANSSQWQQDQ